MTARPWILLPIETKAREFHAKVLQAAVAAEGAFDVVLGEQNALVRQLPWLPRGIYVDKSIGRTKTQPFRRLASLGYRIAAWCEEGLVYRDRDTYLHERVATDSLALADRFFAWGDVQAADIGYLQPSVGGKIRVSGNPRFDVLRPELRGMFGPEADGIRQRHGAFILVVTNFGRYNHFMGRGFPLEVQRRRGAIRSESDAAAFQDWHEYQGVLFRSFSAMVSRLCKGFPRHTVVVRPHPSENHDAWRSEIAGLNNAVVAFDGSSIPWITAAGAVVHNSCTTGVESFMLGQTAITYRPVRNDKHDAFLPNALSREADDHDSLVALVRDGLAGTLAGVIDAARVADRYVASQSGPLAAERVVAELATLEVRPTLYRPTVTDRLSLSADAALERLLPLLRSVRVGRRADAYARQKFPGIAVAEVQDVLRRIQAVTGRFAGVTACALPAHGCFHVGMR